ncbi:MAG TPA: hydroxylamine reductase, partial [Bacteroidales bacterium]|nr:hydroxylamine reductase [Bacteroidales bacterium]
MSMFCNQCQETAKNTGCTISGVCGKKEITSDLQDLLVYACQGLAFATTEARKSGVKTDTESRHIVNSLFMTITNANFDDRSIIKAVQDCLVYRDSLKERVNIPFLHESVRWSASSETEFYEKAKQVGTLTYD